MEECCEDINLKMMILRKNPNTKYSDYCSDLTFWVYFDCPQCSSLVFRIMHLYSRIKPWLKSSGKNARKKEKANREKAANVWVQFLHQNAIWLFKFQAGGKLLVPSEFKSSFELRFKTFSQKRISKNPENCGNHCDCYKNRLFCSIWDIWDICDSFWIKNHPNIVVYIVHTISNIFVLALENKTPPTYKQPKVPDNKILKLNDKNTRH